MLVFSRWSWVSVSLPLPARAVSPRSCLDPRRRVVLAPCVLPGFRPRLVGAHLALGFCGAFRVFVLGVEVGAILVVGAVSTRPCSGLAFAHVSLNFRSRSLFLLLPLLSGETCSICLVVSARAWRFYAGVGA